MWHVVPLGLTNAPGVFMRVINRLFKDLLDERVVVFLDDILICITTAKQHLDLLRKVLCRLQ